MHLHRLRKKQVRGKLNGRSQRKIAKVAQGTCNRLEQIREQKIKDEFLLKPVKRLAGELNTSYGRIMRFLKRNGLEIPKTLIEQRKLDSRKKKGNIPFNKGKKQVEYMTWCTK